MPRDPMPEGIQPGGCMGSCEVNIIAFFMIFDF